MRKLIVSRLPTALLTLLLSSSPARAVEEVLQAGSAGRALSLSAETALLSRGEGEARRLPAPEGAVFSALAAIGDSWIAAASYPDEGGGRRLLLIRGTGDSVETLLPPRRQTGLLRQSPALLTDGEGLVGLAWLEGDDRGALEVRAARWTGRRFRDVHRVAPAAAGSQLSLSGTVLADGSWLLAWSAFDGSDDEILWSQRIGGRWLPPSPATEGNDVPDITPALSACGTGAVMAWSRYDGNDYRLQLASFRHGGWEEVTTLGEPGSLYPAFISAPDEPPRVLYRTAGSGGWQALELDATGAPRRQAQVSAAPRQRPVVTTTPAGGLTFHWPGQVLPRNAAWQPVSQGPRP